MVWGNRLPPVTDSKIMKVLHPCRILGGFFGLALAMQTLIGCDAKPPSPSAAGVTQPMLKSAPESSPGAMVFHLPLPGNADYLLVDDFDQDGRPDLALTDHGANLSRLFLQRDSRQWQAGPVITAVGFHPGELLRAPDVEEPPRYLMLAEGENRLRVMTVTEAGGLAPAAELGATAPRAGTWFRWPGWGLSLVFAPFVKSSIVLVKDFNPTTALAADSLTLNFLPKFAQAEQVAAADLDGDGSDEILFTNAANRSLMQIRYPGADSQPVIETLWTFKQGGRSRFVFPVDLDQDGDLDLLVPDEIGLPGSEESNINVLIKGADGGWDPRVITFPSSAGGSKAKTGVRGTAFGKDQDGQAYILAAGYNLLTLIRIPPAWNGEEPELRQINLSSKVALPAATLKDLDGDGWLDAVLAGGMDKAHGGMIIYGPLWQGFAVLSGKDLDVPLTTGGTSAESSEQNSSRPAAEEKHKDMRHDGPKDSR